MPEQKDTFENDRTQNVISDERTPSSTPNDVGQSVRVLHVDDDENLVEMAATFLERINDEFTVVTETSAQDGLDRLDTDQIDCIVSDYQMPGMDGLEFLEAVREEDADIPFILFTGKGSEAVASDAIAAGVTDYLQKETGTDQYKILANRIHNCVSQVRTQQALDHTEEEFRHLVDAVVDYAIFMFDPEGYVTSWNRGAEVIKGYRRDEIVGEHFSVFYPEADREAGRPSHLLEEAAANNHVEDEGWRVRTDGSQFWANVTITALHDEAGNIRGFAKVTRDMTERKQQREALKEEKDRFQSMVQEVKDYAIFMLDQDGHIASWNAGARQIKGYQRDDILGEHFSTFYPDEAVESSVPDQLLETARTDGRVEHEGWRVRKDGSRFWADVVITALHDDDGDVRGFSKVTRDMTNRREYQQQLEHQTEQMEELLRVVAHDLQKPVSVAQGNIELTKESGEATHFETVETALDRMAAIVDEILDISEAGIIISDTSPVALADVADRAWEMIETDAATLVMDELGTIKADEVQLQSIFENLLQNAVIHGGGGAVTVGALENGFYMADEGTGIPAEDRKKVLEYGYSTRDAGTGFGLSIVKTIVEAHGWTLAVAESVGGGARIEIDDMSSVK